MRITRSAVLEVLREDYIRTARAKGQSARVVIWRHALQNALLPVVTVIGIEFAFMIGARGHRDRLQPAGWRFLVERSQWRDYPMVQNLVMFIAIVVILANLSVDILYGVLDPRVRYGSKAGVVDARGQGAGPRRAEPGLGRSVAVREEEAPRAVGGLIMAAILLTALLASVFATHDPIAADAALGRRHRRRARLGTDNLGRDIYSRIVHGARISSSWASRRPLLGSVLGG